MNVITAEHITKNYTGRLLFDDITFGFDDTDKVGIIGINGTGKSTLLNIIAGREEPDDGKIIKGNNIKIAFLEQNPILDEKLSILENVIGDEKENWDMEGSAKSILNKLGFTDYGKSAANLSGGEKKRVALVRTILHPADVLILDEPTNHLDAQMAAWLENFLKNYRGTVIMVTHDRYFLDKVTNKIYEIDKGKIYSYETNYSGFLELKAQREEMEIATERKNKSLYRMELEWMMRGARARSTKQKAHIQRFENLRDRQKPVEEESMELSSVSSRLGKKTIEIENVSKSFEDRKLFEDFSYIFLRNDRIGIVGSNGCGKSTLLKIIMDEIKPDTGHIEIGTTVKIGYFSQMNEYLDESQRVIDYVKETAEYIMTTQGRISASAMCEKLLFDSQMQYSLIGKLSGGEKRRLYLLHVLMEQPNVLILDEPTNDLDIKTMTILEDYLKTFDGIVITVSHDRFFLDKIVNRIFSFENGDIVQYEGGYSDFISVYNEKHKNDDVNGSISSYEKVKKENQVQWKKENKKVKFSYNEQREFNTIDDDIEKIENDISNVDKQILENATNSVKLGELMIKKEELENLLEEKMQRWIYLNELAQQIEESK